ncbi:MAG: class I SAM-dependent RNA methyltransferase [Magnetospirillum sp.]|nr:class I SAM-dependent RNA methyltransferase [Magnetospirillum sp.]
MRKPRRSPARQSRNTPPPRNAELLIEEIGTRGDGIAHLDGDAVFVPFTVTGDRVLARIEGRRGDGLTAALIEVMEPGPGRAAPPCTHFGRCGGCSLQHLDDGLYAHWKRDLLLTQLARQGLAECAVDPLVRVPPGSRRRAALVHFAGVAVEPAPGAFLQPTRGGELAIAEAVLAGIGTISPVADLYAGCGSFSLPLALKGPVHAVEGEQAPVLALDAAARREGLPLTSEVRDLARRPLSAHELKAYKAVCLDPPRAGAQAQIEELAKPIPGGPGTIAMVSCNPATLARDLRLLVNGGWRLERITPIDQFPWAAHLEAVAILRR